MSHLSTKDLTWFRLANSNPPAGFYDFKGRFLKRFAATDGWDKQEIERACHGCDGSGQYLENVECNRCNGSGIYDTRRVCEAIKDRAYWFRVKLVWKLIRMRNRMDLFKAIPDDEIPF